MSNRSDNFNRTDTPSGPLGTPSDGGSDWVQSGTTHWGIETNIGRSFTAATPKWAYLECGSADGDWQATLQSAGGTSDNGLLLRFSDSSNYFRLYTISNFCHLDKIVAGSATNVASNDTFTFSAGDVVKVTMSGNNFTVFVNGVSKISTSSTFNNTATKHGLYNSSSGAVKWDDVSFTGASSFSADRANVLTGSGTVTLTLTGSGTSWTGSPFSLSATQTGWSLASQNVISGTSATVTLNRGSGTGTITISDGSLTTNVTATITATTTASGNWGSTSSWDVGSVPTTGNRAVIAHDTTVAATDSIGDSPGDSTTFVLTVNASKTITVSSGVTFTVKGNIDNNGTIVVGDLTGGGATLTMSAASASPTSTTYKIYQDNANSTIKVYGTSGSRAALSSNASGGNAYITPNSNCGLLIDFRFADITRIGDGTNDAIKFGNTVNPGSATEWLHLTSCTFTSCGRLFTGNSFPANAYWTITGSAGNPTKFTSGAHATDDINIIGGSGTTSKIEYCSCSKLLYTSPASTTIGPYVMFGAKLGHADDATWNDIDKVVFWADDVGSGAHVLRGNVSNAYYYAGGTDNPHFPLCRSGLGAAKTASASVVEYGGTFATDGGNIFYFTSTQDWSVTTSIIIPSATTSDTGAGAFTSGGVVGLSITHCTIYSPDYSGGVLIGDGGSVAGMYPTVKDNIFWVKSTDTAGVAAHSIGTTADNSITPTNCTNNGCLNLASTRYQGSYPTTQPGASDNVVTGTNEATIFVDPTRNLATWAVSRGSGSSTYANKVADAKTYLLADPSLLDDLLSHIRAGFAVKYTAWRTASSTGNVVGAVQTAPASGHVWRNSPLDGLAGVGQCRFNPSLSGV